MPMLPNYGVGRYGYIPCPCLASYRVGRYGYVEQAQKVWSP